MKRLARIRLINWHRFTHHTFEVDGHLLLMGDNGSGKSTILDALQVGLVGNMRSVRLNLAANEGGDRSLKSYVLGLVGGTGNGHPARTIRKNATAYILLEFADTETQESLVLGTVIDAHSDGRSPDKEHFIASNSGVEDCPCVNEKNVPRSVREFKRELAKRKSCKRYARVEEYQQAVLKHLGGLDPEFFRLFVSGMAFRKIRNLRDFVYDFLLPEAAEVQVASLREAAERYRQLHELSKEAEERINLLDRIAANAQSTEAGQKEADQLCALIDRARLAACEETLSKAQANHARIQQELAEATSHHTECESAQKLARETLTRLQQELAGHEKQSGALAIENRVERLADQIRHENRDSERLEQSLRASREAIAPWRKLLDESVFLPGNEASPKRFREELASAFGPQIVSRLEDFDAIAADCLAGENPPPERRNIVRQVAEDWPAVGHWLQSVEFQLDLQIQELNRQHQTLEAELAELQTGHRPLPPGLVKLQETFQNAGVPSTVFCEVLEIANPALRDSIEAVLSRRRYDLLVAPEDFSKALAMFRQIRDPEQSQFGLVDTPRLLQQSISISNGSLAEAVQTSHPLARQYADVLLGRGFCEGKDSAIIVDTPDVWTVTEDGFLRADYSIRRLPDLSDHEKSALGKEGMPARSDALEESLNQIQSRTRTLSELRGRIQSTNELFDRGRRGPELLAEDYDLPSRLKALRQEYRVAREEAAMVKESDLGQLRQMVETAEAAEHQAAKNLKHAWGRQCVCEQSLKSSEAALANAENLLQETKTAYQTNWSPGSELAEHCEDVMTSGQFVQSWDELISLWTAQLQTLRKSFSQRHDDGVRLRTEYNNRFQFTGDCLSENIETYLAEAARWVESELPSYGSQLELARNTARQVLEEEVIHRLRERLSQVERHFRELNRALDGLNFSGREYQFTYAVRREFQPFYEMIAAAEAMADRPLHESEWHAQFAEGPLKDLLEDVLGSGGQRALTQLEHVTDYRAYFEYDIEITEADGTVHAFSQVAGSGSGGETQTPYYVAMLASLARVYRTHGGQGSRAALVAFDEPFQKMDESNIAATLRLAHRLGLQVLLAAPKDRCHQLLPAMGTATCLLVLREGNRVLLEPFQRIAGELSEPTEDDAQSRLLMPQKPKPVK